MRVTFTGSRSIGETQVFEGTAASAVLFWVHAREMFGLRRGE
jgi:hypothetical protein